MDSGFRRNDEVYSAQWRNPAAFVTPAATFVMMATQTLVTPAKAGVHLQNIGKRRGTKTAREVLDGEGGFRGLKALEQG